MSTLILKRKEELTIVQGGLHLYYLLSEGSGQTLTDLSGLGNHGTLGSTAGADTNDPTWVSEGLGFSTDDYVMSANHISTRPDAWTVCVALQLTAAVDDQPLVAWGPISNARPGIYGSFLGSPFRPIVYQGASNFRYFKSNDPVNLQNGGWHFLVFRCPGTTATDIQNTSLRVDGQQQVVDSTNSGGAAQDKAEFRIGALSNKYFSDIAQPGTEHGGSGSDAAIREAGTCRASDASVSDYFLSWYVSPHGFPNGRGTPESPWDIESALSHREEIGPGDSIWLLGGTYRPARTLLSALRGEAGRPIIVRADPASGPVVIDFVNNPEEFCLRIQGEHTWYRGFELTNSRTTRWTDVEDGAYNPRGIGVECEGGLGTKLINLRIHDFGTSLFESQTSGLEIYGCLFFNSYWDAPDRAHGPGLYIRNRPTSPRKTLENNIVFQHGRQGLQGFGSVPFANFDVIGNILFNNGIAADGFHRNLMFGSASDQHIDNVFAENYTYFAPGGGSHQFNMFGGDGGCHGLTLQDNVFAADQRIAAGINRCDGAQISRNRFVGNVEFVSFDGEESLREAEFQARFPMNEYCGAGEPGPTGMWVHVHGNRYLPDPWEHRGVAHVVVYNWDDATDASVDLTPLEQEGKITPGTTVTVRPVQNLSESETQMYDGNALRVRMLGWTPAAPIGRDLTTNPLPATFPQFGAFVLDWAVSGAAPPDGGPRVMTDPGRELSLGDAWEARLAAWHVSDAMEREKLKQERLFAWRAERWGRV